MTQILLKDGRVIEDPVEAAIMDVLYLAPTEKGTKSRTWIKPYARADGVHVEGHWRRGKGNPVVRVDRSRRSDDHLALDLLKAKPQADELLTNGDFTAKQVFYALVDTKDDVKDIDRVLSAVESVHDFGADGFALRRTPIVRGLSSRWKDEPLDGTVGGGAYLSRPRSSGSDDPYQSEFWPAAIFVNPASPSEMQQVSLLHEIGHYVDQQMLGRGVWASFGVAFSEDRDSPVGKVFDTLERSNALERLAWMYESDAKATALVKHPNGKMSVETIPFDKDFILYLISPEETFARAYSQYVARKAGLTDAVSEISHKTVSRGSFYPEQWDEEDFKPIAEAFDALFAART